MKFRSQIHALYHRENSYLSLLGENRNGPQNLADAVANGKYFFIESVPGHTLRSLGSASVI
jgi:hypothetical protein